MHWRLHGGAQGGKMNSPRFIYHTRCLPCSTKDEKMGKQMAKQINYTKRNHVTCQIHSVLCHSAPLPLPTAHIFVIDFFKKPYTLLTPFMLHQFTEVDSTPSSSFSSNFNETKSNKHCVCSLHLLLF